HRTSNQAGPLAGGRRQLVPPARQPLHGRCERDDSAPGRRDQIRGRARGHAAMTMRRHLSCIAAIIALSAVTARPGFPQQPSPVTEGCPTSYIIGPEDVLDIAVWDNTELTRTVPVR